MNDQKNIPTSRADLAGAELIAEVNSRNPGKDVWTALSIWYRRGHDRPFVAVIEGCVSEEMQTRSRAAMVPRFKAFAVGSLSRAQDMFDPSTLRQSLICKVPEDAHARFPDSNTVRMQEADERRASRGYMGKVNLGDALEWLYPNPTSVNAVADRFETDFGIGSRTTRGILAKERDGEAAPTWVEAFVTALRYFDRKAWDMSK